MRSEKYNKKIEEIKRMSDEVLGNQDPSLPENRAKAKAEVEAIKKAAEDAAREETARRVRAQEAAKAAQGMPQVPGAARPVQEAPKVPGATMQVSKAEIAEAQAKATMQVDKREMAGGGKGKPKKKKKRIWPKVLIIFLILAVAAAAGVYFGGKYYIKSKINKNVHKEELDESKLSIVDVDGYVNIALLGVDARSMSKKNLKDANTDCIIVLSMNTETNEVNLISVYRDTYLRIADTPTYTKINSAFVYGGPQYAVQSLNQALDLNINTYAIFNFKMVSDLVNGVGGIEVNVKDYEIEELNKYTIQTARNVGQKKYKLVEAPGKQTLEGVQAVSYGRIRKGVGDDFKRTDRMRFVIKKVTEKLKTRNIAQLTDLLDVALTQCKTNMSDDDMMSLAMKMTKFEITKSVGFPYEKTTGYLGQASYVFPIDLAANTTRLHQELFNQPEYQVSETCQEISNQVAAGLNSASGGPQ